MANIIIVTKDNAEFLQYSSVVSLLRQARHNVTVVAEGLSLGKWNGLHEPVYMGTVELDENGFRSDIHVPTAFDGLSPDLVLTGLGDPINLGESFGLEANQRGIKLGYLEDVWGVHTRSRAVPGFVCTLDPFGERLIQTFRPYEGKLPRIYRTGSPAKDALVSVRADPYVATVASRYDLCILLAGQDECTTHVVVELLGAAKIWKGQGQRVLLIPRLHPKFQDKAVTGQWFEQLAQAPCDVLWVNSAVSTTQIMLSAELTVSVFSGALTDAAILGSVPVSCVSEVGRASMRASMGGLERFPLVDYDCAVEVKSARGFVAIEKGVRDEIRDRCRDRLPNDGKSAERVVAAIETELTR